MWRHKINEKSESSQCFYNQFPTFHQPAILFPADTVDVNLPHILCHLPVAAAIPNVEKELQDLLQFDNNLEGMKWLSMTENPISKPYPKW